MRYFFALLISLLMIASSSTVYGSDLGAGYTCLSAQIAFKASALTSDQALSKVSKQIKNAKAKLALAKLSGDTKLIKKLKAKLKTLKGAKVNIQECADLAAMIAALAVAYSPGTWNNTTFSTNGAILVSVTNNGSALSFNIDIDGDMFGSLDPGPILFQIDYSDLPPPIFPLQHSETGTTIGDISITIQHDASFTVEENMVPVVGILGATLNATTSSTAITGDFHSTLLGGMHLADGTINIPKS